MVIKYEQPPPEIVERHYQELGITDKSLRRDIATLRDWMQKQPHLPDNVADATLEKFLIHSKNSLERTKAKLDQYYCGRVLMADMFHNRDPLDPKIKNIAKVAMYCPCPKPTPEGDRVTIIKTFDYDLSKFDVLASIKVGLMLLDAHMEEETCRKHVIIFDFEGNSMGHAAAFTIPVIKKALSIFLEVLPQRFAGFHVVNAPSYFVNVVNIAKGLLHTKLAQRVHVHGKGTASLLELIPEDVLPPDYGGTYPAKLDELREMAYQSLVERRNWFLEQNKVHADLDKRPSQKKTSGDIDHQLHGSFRQIVID